MELAEEPVTLKTKSNTVKFTQCMNMDVLLVAVNTILGDVSSSLNLNSARARHPSNILVAFTPFA
jgi:hypothetical protein